MTINAIISFNSGKMENFRRAPQIFQCAAVLSLGLTLAACGRDGPAPAPPETASTEPAEPVSIFRPEMDVDQSEPELGPIEATVGFAKGGYDLSDQARTQIETILSSPQMQAGGPIILRGHSDATGFDKRNLRASRLRAEAVRNYFIEKGIAEDRIEVIAMGEMRPIAPNAKLDGTPDEEGRAANRRVDVTVMLPGSQDAAPEDAAEQDAQSQKGTGTLAETIAQSD